MNSTRAPTSMPAQVLVLLDDAAAGSALLELSSALARAMQRDLSLVYVESARALVAAALPFTQVLSHAGSQWVPLQPQDVEQGFRAQAARLRELAARIALRDALNWSLRVMRGSLAGAAADLIAQSDLLLLAAAASVQPPRIGAARPARRRPLVSVVTVADGDEDELMSQRALRVGTQLAQALAGELQTTRIDAATLRSRPATVLATLARSDVLVLPRAPLDAAALATLRCPVLLVG